MLKTFLPPKKVNFARSLSPKKVNFARSLSPKKVNFVRSKPINKAEAKYLNMVVDRKEVVINHWMNFFVCSFDGT